MLFWAIMSLFNLIFGFFSVVGLICKGVIMILILSMAYARDTVPKFMVELGKKSVAVKVAIDMRDFKAIGPLHSQTINFASTNDKGLRVVFGVR
jgi:hypothetical protein